MPKAGLKTDPDEKIGTNATGGFDEDQKPKPAEKAEGANVKAEPVAISRRKKKRKAKVFDENAPDVFVPTHERLTAKGGYAHTSRSKSRISKANKGNTPWNKGKTRSSADKAKIAAAVRARNRTILLEKLKRLGITEEEWLEKKKQIKYLRERIRRAKRQNQKHIVEMEEKKLKEALEEEEGKRVSDYCLCSIVHVL